ncbi:unnamed protein product, partial [Rotaria socialis]
MKEFDNHPAKIDITNMDGQVNASFVGNPTDYQLQTISEEEYPQASGLLRGTAASASSFQVHYEAASGEDSHGITFAPPPPAPSSAFTHHHQQHHRSNETGTFERQSSILDPMSDRVSTILVWKNLVVFTREDKKKLFFKRCLSKNAEPKSK